MLGKKAVLLLTVSGVAVSLVACGANPTTQSKDSASAASEPSGTLHFYTSQPDADAAALVKAFNKKYPNVKVETFRSGTEEVVSKLLAESKANNVQADVLLMADAPTFVRLKKQGLLMSYKSKEGSGIPANLKDPGGDYYGTKIMATVLMVNTNDVKSLPSSWKVLTDPKTSGKSIMPSPLYSGAAAYNVGVFSRQSDFGWDFFKQLANNKVTVSKGNGSVLKSVASGEKDYGMIVDFMAAKAKKQGSPVDFVYPSEGVPVITEPVAITKATKNPIAAKAFEDFILSSAGQKVEASRGYTPIRQGIKAPEGLKTIDQIKIISANPDQLETTREADKKKFGEIISGK
ncbi:ABC transporter substrate-binding protein [Fodinisporobacter ferrooxydans]|uniref:ABC transporter substrate-binding protein n=2 Tax=Fodinisporobacter ferrooxydans TaxID=2901836 RepID=A0ABY4CSU3_9BACL|nr:ABC transporter substrate-binding protein [Alicyclobacillaceae bacterium MYW30-H2]